MDVQGLYRNVRSALLWITEKKYKNTAFSIHPSIPFRKPTATPSRFEEREKDDEKAPQKPTRAAEARRNKDGKPNPLPPYQPSPISNKNRVSPANQNSQSHLYPGLPPSSRLPFAPRSHFSFLPSLLPFFPLPEQQRRNPHRNPLFKTPQALLPKAGHSLCFRMAASTACHSTLSSSAFLAGEMGEPGLGVVGGWLWWIGEGFGCECGFVVRLEEQEEGFCCGDDEGDGDGDGWGGFAGRGEA